ncbi:MAG: hypothetical protein J6R47_04695 [Acholeplasmatales bacterium]|nr:hypothetical protein [Acholeplasmatales bacterium]
MNKIYVTWDEITSFINELVNHLNNKNIKPSGVYGIPRGGLVMASLISYKMNIPLLMAPTEGCLIIDDIADSGRSLCHYTENDTQFNKYFIATLFYHNRSIVKPHYTKFEKIDEWIVFPWEEI